MTLSKTTKALTALVLAAILALGLSAMLAQPAHAAAKPAQVKGVTAKATGSTSAKVSWKAAKKAKGYQVRWSAKSTMAGAKSATLTARTKAVKGLKNYTKYYFQVRAYAKSGSKKVWGAWSAKATARTTCSHPAAKRKTTTEAATCTADGSKKVTCTVCAKVLSNSTTSKALGHDGEKRCTRCAEILYSWAELKTIADELSACSTMKAAVEKAKTYELVESNGLLTGKEVKTIALKNGTKCQIQILGFWNDEKASGGKAGITFGFKTVVDTHVMNTSKTNNGGWEASAMRTWLNGTFYNSLPSDLSEQIVAANKKTNNIGKTTSDSSVTSTADKLWLLSLRECFGSSWLNYVKTDTAVDKAFYNVFAGEGGQYLLYNMNSSNDRVLVDLEGEVADKFSLLVKKSVNGSASSWWLRSPCPDGGEEFYFIDNKSAWDYDYANKSFGVAPCFCL